MKKAYLVLLALSVALFSGCAKKSSTAAAAPAPQNGPKTFELTGNDTMKYNLTQLEVSPGEEVKLTMTNIGTLPIQAMGHNWTLLKKGTDVAAFDAAAATHQADGYFPTDLASEVIAHTKLLGPKQSDTITFKAPTEPGDYTYLCTFPGHYAAGMHGVLTVK